MVDCKLQNSNFLNCIQELIKELNQPETVIMLENYNVIKKCA